MSHGRYNPHREAPAKKDDRGVSWRVKAPLLLVAMLFGLISHTMSNWGEPIFFAAIALIVPILLYRKLWGLKWFWLTVTILGAIQIPLVVAAGPLIAQARAYYTLVFAIADGMFVIVVISTVCSKLCGGNGTEA